MGDQCESNAPGKLVFGASLVVILIVAAALRFWGVSDRELWFDENCTYYIVHHLSDWPADGPRFDHEVGHIPYFLLLRLWAWMTGESILGMRSLSAVAGVATVAVLAWLGTLLGGRGAGLIAGLLAAVHPLHIHYSQEARSYSLWMLGVTGCTCVLYRAATSLRVRWWAAYVAGAWLTFMTHYYTLLWFPGTLAALWVAANRRRFARQWLMAHTALAAACAPVIWFLVIPLSQHGARPWFREMWESYPPPLAVAKSIWAMLPSGGYPDYLGSLAVAGDAAATAFGDAFGPLIRWGPAMLTMFLVMAALARPRPVATPTGDPDPPPAADPTLALRGLLWLSTMSAAFLVATFMHSAIMEPTYVVARYDLAAWPSLVPALAILITLAAARRGSFPLPLSQSPIRRGGGEGGVSLPAVLTAIVTLAFIGSSAATIAGMHRAPVTNQHRARAARIAAMVGPNDLVVSVNKYKLFVLYELVQRSARFEIISFPPRHDRQLCWQDAEAELADPEKLEAGVREVAGRIEQALDRGRRVWILAHGVPSGARFEVDRRLFVRLSELGISARPVEDESLGLAELVPTSSE